MDGSSAVAVATDLDGSPAVAEPRRGRSPTVRPIYNAEETSSGEWEHVSAVSNTLEESSNQQYTDGGTVSHGQDLLSEWWHADDAPAAVEKAVDAAGGTSAVPEPTNIEADPPVAADAGNTAGASSKVVESAPAATDVKDANSAAGDAPVVAGTALATTAENESKIAEEFADGTGPHLNREESPIRLAAANPPDPLPGSMPTRPTPWALVHAPPAK